MNRIGIVILNWNGKELLKQFLPSVVSHSKREWAEIIVADNASTDNSIAFLEQEYPDIRLIQLDKNYGFAEGYNRALAQLDHEYFVLLNSDVEVSENWLDSIYQQFENNTDIAAAQPKIKAYHNKSGFEYAGAAGGLSIIWDTHFAEVEFLIPLRKTLPSTITTLMCCGPVVLPCLSELISTRIQVV